MSDRPRPAPGEAVPMRYARNVVRFAVLLGADRARLLAAAGLDPARLDDLDGWLEAETMDALFDAAVAETGDPNFGLRLGNQAQPGAVAIVGYAMLSADTLGDALGDLVRYAPMIATVQRVRLDEGALGRPAVLEFVPFRIGPMAGGRRQMLEATLATFMTMARTVTGRPLPVQAVALGHARPPTGTAVHEAVFGVPPTFDADGYRIAFDAAALRWRGRSASRALHAAFRRDGDRLLKALLGSVRTRATRAIADALEGAIPTLGEVAEALAMSERTLQRHLDDEGTTFQLLLDEVRRGLAVHHLRGDDRTVQEVATLLGYSAPSAFHRAFKRWTGQTPGAFRRAARQEERA